LPDFIRRLAIALQLLHDACTRDRRAKARQAFSSRWKGGASYPACPDEGRERRPLGRSRTVSLPRETGVQSVIVYRIHITAEPQGPGTDASYRVAVMLPGQSSAPTALINEHNLQVILHEVLPAASAAELRERLTRSHSSDGALFEVPSMSEQHFNMLRGLPPRAVGR